MSEPGKLQDFDLEAAYDEEIAPLMKQIIALCHKHKMPMFATFNYGYNGEEDRQDFCTTLMVEAPDGENMVMAKLRPLMERCGVDGSVRPAPLCITTRGGDGQITRMETVIP